MKLKETDFRVLGELRRDARQSLVSISEKTGIPASTVFKAVRRLESKAIVKRYFSSVDYPSLIPKTSKPVNHSQLIKKQGGHKNHNHLLLPSLSNSSTKTSP